MSGTILSFEMGMLWPGLMGTFGAVFGLPFALAGIAFFIEAIFLGIYLYGWKRLTPTRHLLTGLPIVIPGTASAFFVVAANAWMNEPRGFDLVNHRMVNADPWGAMFNPATPIQTTHMILAAFMVTGFVMVSVLCRCHAPQPRRCVSPGGLRDPLHHGRRLHAPADRGRRLRGPLN